MEELREEGNKGRLILDAARRVFAATGYYQARVEDIAREAGVGKGTVYEYFVSKEDLYLKMLLEVADSYVTGVKGELEDAGGDIRDKLFFTGRHLASFLAQHGQLARMVLQDPGPINFKFKDHLRKIRRDMVKMVAALLTDTVPGPLSRENAEVAARFFLAGLAGVVYPETMQSLAPPGDLKTAVDVFVQGVNQCSRRTEG